MTAKQASTILNQNTGLSPDARLALATLVATSLLETLERK